MAVSNPWGHCKIQVGWCMGKQYSVWHVGSSQWTSVIVSIQNKNLHELIYTYNYIKNSLSSSKSNDISCYANLLNFEVHISHYRCSLIHSNTCWLPSIPLRLRLVILLTLCMWPNPVIFLFLLPNLASQCHWTHWHSLPGLNKTTYVFCVFSPKNLLF